jgi:membrane-bound lytic murein transglycosylase B
MLGAAPLVAQDPPPPPPPPPPTTQTQTQTPPPTEPAPPQPTFAEFLAGVRVDALARGLRESIVDAALTSFSEPLAVVVARDRSQPERVRSLEDYLDTWMTPKTLATAGEMAAKHGALLKNVSEAYRVPAAILVSVLGLESSFGRFTGTHPTIQALATLAYDPRRSKLFRNELLDALTILDKGHADLESMKGSWAGAMGQPQFMPSSYLKHAVDFDGDGRTDIWHSEADVFASIGNYLKAAGWDPDLKWGREVKLSRAVVDTIERDVPMRRTGCAAVREQTVAKPLAEWDELGVKSLDGSDLPKADVNASLVRGESRAFLVYRNYQAIIDYNCSNSYAISVGLVADKITGK